jgi:hypothetical protein
MIEHPHRSTSYRPHAVRIQARTDEYARPMAARVKSDHEISNMRAWQPSEAPGLRAALWRTVLSVVHTMWAE